MHADTLLSGETAFHYAPEASGDISGFRSPATDGDRCLPVTGVIRSVAWCIDRCLISTIPGEITLVDTVHYLLDLWSQTGAFQGKVYGWQSVCSAYPSWYNVAIVQHGEFRFRP